MKVSIDELLTTIGLQTVEINLLRKQVEELLAPKESPNGVPENGTVDEGALGDNTPVTADEV